MPIRPGRTTREIERPYTRQSRRNPRKSYVVGVPFSKIHIFEMGNPTKKFDTCLNLVVGHPVQIRDNALEAARQYVHKIMEEKLLGQYYFEVRVFPQNPHHRHEPFAASCSLSLSGGHSSRRRIAVQTSSQLSLPVSAY
jgi:large subunit ribosomal protein L10e